jgi:hypothetical protein
MDVKNVEQGERCSSTSHPAGAGYAGPEGRREPPRAASYDARPISARQGLPSAENVVATLPVPGSESGAPECVGRLAVDGGCPRLTTRQQGGHTAVLRQ